MSPKLKNILFGTGMLVLLIVVGYYREIFFVHVNMQVYMNYYHETDGTYNYHFPEWLLFLKQYSNTELFRIKWIMTVLVFFFYMAVCLLTVWFYFRKKQYSLITIGIHGLLFMVAGIFYTIGKITGKSLEGYTLAREFMGILQSPLVLMILLPTFIISSKNNNSES